MSNYINIPSTAQATILGGNIDVSTDAADDSIRVEDGHGNALKINADGSINANITIVPASNLTTISKYNEVVSVGTGIETLIVNYTVPIGKTAYLQYISEAGTNISEYRIYKNATVIDKDYTMFGTSLSTSFDYRNEGSLSPGIVFSSGDVISVKILNPRPYTGNFNARIQVVEVS